MELTTKWKATWRDTWGHLQVYSFYGPNSLMLARLDFRLKLMEQGKPVPDDFDLEDITLAPPVIWGKRV